MTQINVLEAKNSLSRLLRRLENGEETSFVIARNGTPVARIVPYESDTISRRIGIARGARIVDDDWDIHEGDDEIAQLFGVDE